MFISFVFLLNHSTPSDWSCFPGSPVCVLDPLLSASVSLIIGKDPRSAAEAMVGDGKSSQAAQGRYKLSAFLQVYLKRPKKGKTKSNTACCDLPLDLSATFSVMVFPLNTLFMSCLGFVVSWLTHPPLHSSLNRSQAALFVDSVSLQVYN